MASGAMKMPGRDGSSPQYVALARKLIGAIATGRHPVGSLLPTEMDLCRDSGMSRITVRAALRELEVRGLVSRRAGIGTRVETASIADPFVHTASSVEEFLQGLMHLRFRKLKHRMVLAKKELAGEIGCAAGDRLLSIESLRVHPGGEPVCLSFHHVPEAYAAAALKMNGRSGSLASYVAEANGDAVGEFRQTFDAQNLTAGQARLLRARPNEAALVTSRWYYAPGSRLLLYSRSLFPRGRAIYDFRSRRAGVIPVGARARGKP